MPIVKEPHFCQPPAWTWLFRIDTVWRCPKCKTNFRLVKKYSDYGDKVWRPLPQSD